jgi:RNA polymerase sigma-70 factor (ECF subfamily)
MDTQPSPTDDSARGILASPEDWRTVEALRNGDEAAFAMLISEYQGTLVRIASMYVNDRAIAEEVAQETWVAVLQGIGRFEGRSSLKTWLFRILTNRAKTRAQREARYAPLSTPDDDSDEPSVSPDRFNPDTDHWAAFPSGWQEIPEDRLLSQETRAIIQTAIDTLPHNQREVITLRDINGWGSDEVCNVLNISETNQRVLLHRARSRVRQALEHYLAE